MTQSAFMVWDKIECTMYLSFEQHTNFSLNCQIHVSNVYLSVCLSACLSLLLAACDSVCSHGNMILLRSSWFEHNDVWRLHIIIITIITLWQIAIHSLLLLKRYTYWVSGHMSDTAAAVVASSIDPVTHLLVTTPLSLSPLSFFWLHCTVQTGIL